MNIILIFEIVVAWKLQFANHLIHSILQFPTTNWFEIRDYFSNDEISI